MARAYARVDSVQSGEQERVETLSIVDTLWKKNPRQH